MPIRVEGPDGVTLEFPDGTSQETMRAAMQRRYGAPRQQTRPENPGNYARIGGRPFGGPGGTRQPPPPSGFQRAYQREAALHGSGTQQRPRVPVVSDFNDMISQIPANIGIADDLAGLSARGGQSIENLVRRVQGRPIDITADEAGNAAGQEALDRAQRYRQQNPGGDAMATALSIPALLGTPGGAAGAAVPAWRAGAAAAAMDAPFALARQEGDLGERLPGAAQEVATMGILGTALQGGANALGRMAGPRANGIPRPRQRAQDFADVGVRPTLAATNQGAMAGTTKLIGENFLAGGGVRARLGASLEDTAQAAQRVARGYGTPSGREATGEMVQRGIRRVAQDRSMPQPRPGDPRTIRIRDWSFPAKARALYDDVFQRLARDEEQLRRGNVGSIISTQATESVLDDIMSRVSGPASRQAMQNSRIEEIAQAIRSDQTHNELRFQDLREWRRMVREMQRDQGLRQSVSNADLQRLEGALSQDIYSSAERIGGQAANDLRATDRWYARVNSRIRAALDPFVPKGEQLGGGARAFQRIIDLASSGGRENSRQLSMLRSSLRPEEWRVVSASIIDHMGHPTFGAPNVLEPGAFSVDRFVTNYARLTEEGRRLLFGNPYGRSANTINLQQALDTLARVAGYQKGVERMVNASRSGVNAQNFGSAVGLANPGTMAPTAGVLGGMAITGEMLTNPSFVRWLTSVSRTGASAGGMRQHLSALATIAARDPAVAPFYTELTQRLSGQSQPRTQQQQPQPEPVQ